MLDFDDSTYTSVQSAYDTASAPVAPGQGLGLTDFTLRIATDGLLEENLIFDQEVSVVLEGGWDCSFQNRDNNLATTIAGSLTISGGTVITSNIALTAEPLCQPGDPNNFPGNLEICDGLDNNCNGIADEGLSTDADGDGHYSLTSCLTPNDDCDDNASYNFPGNPEICDNRDNNCDGQIDEGLTAIDADGDGYYASGSCFDGASGDDCNDNNPNINPGAVDFLGDYIDQDCDGLDLTYYSGYNEYDCLGCHGGSFTINNILHQSVAAPDNSCVSCHAAKVNAVLPGHYGDKVQTPDNNMLPGQTIICTSCHDWHDPANGYVINGANQVWPLVAVHKNPVTEVYENVTCDTCHLDRAADHNTEAAHDNRIIDPLCANCHTSDTSILGQPGSGTLETQADVDTLHQNNCSFCHNYTGTAPDPVLVSDAIQNGIGGLQIECLYCHEVEFPTIHAFLENHYALINVGTTSCGNCHSSAPPLIDDTNPKAHSTCSNCHDENYNTISLAAGKTLGPGDCTTCHDTDFTNNHQDAGVDHTAIVTVGDTSCGNCHSDLLVDIDLLAFNDPKVHDACTTCHDANGGLIGRATGKTFAVGGDCTTCHTEGFATIHPASTDHSNIVTTSGTQCGTCHTSTPLVDADPVNADDPKVHDACSTCHDGQGGLIDLASGKSAPGNCNTCHGADFTIIHPDTIDHTAIVTVGNTSCGNCHSDPPPLVDLDPVNANDPKLHDACLSCHNTDGVLQGRAAGKTFAVGGDCATCHTEPFDTVHPDTVDHSQAIQLSTDCSACHSAPPPLVDADPVNADDPKLHDACSSCHDVDGGLINLASGNTAPNECITCHGNDLNTLHPNSNATHIASPGSEDVLVFAAGEHDSAMVGDGTVYMACNTCHSTNLGNVHDNNCNICHAGSPSPYESLNGFWAGGCQQGACHTTKHDGVSDAHNEVTDYAGESNCTDCHGQYWTDFPPLPSSCSNCHATDYISDTEAPVTTSDAQASYIIPALIKFFMTDNGGKVGLGTTYSVLDGGAPQVGSSILVETQGAHELEFWSVDQAGNEELPHNFAYFTIGPDTIPPVTTSNAQSNYETAAYITLTAADNNQAGIITTYYSLDSGPVQEGNFVHVPEPNGTVTYSLEFWSVDWTGNEELPHKTETFTIYGGTGTIRLVWGNSDNTGVSPCVDDPNAYAYWEINRPGLSTIFGSASCSTDPNWSGVNDIVVEVSQSSYYVDIWWYSDYNGFEELTEYPFTDVTTHGEVLRLTY